MPAQLTSGTLAKLTGVSTDTLRLYERKGLLAAPPRSANGYRVYPLHSVGRVRLIRAALSIGFTLNELAEILAMRDRGGAPCASVRRMAGAKLRALERHIEKLSRLRQQIRNVIREWDALLGRRSGEKRAGLLEALAAAIPSGAQRLPPELYTSLSRKEKRQ
jgi:DNA-binding transcriptional MerR regulator